MAGSDQLFYLIGRHGQRVAHHAARLVVILEVFYFLALGIQFLWRVESDVGLAVVEQLLDVFLVDIATLALTVGAVVASK